MQKLVRRSNRMAALQMTNARKIEVQGHRGQPILYPENTIPSFISAAMGGADAVELDVLMSRDRKLVIHHNNRTNPGTTAYRSGIDFQSETLIKDVTYQFLQDLNVGAKIPKVFEGERVPVKDALIPTLEDLFSATKYNDWLGSIKLNLEIKQAKDETFPPDDIVNELLRLFDMYKVDQTTLAISSFDVKLLSLARKTFPSINIGMLAEEYDTADLIIKRAKEVEANIVSPHYSSIKSRDDVGRFQSLGYRVITYTANDIYDWKAMIEFGVDGIITDRPTQLVNYLRAWYADQLGSSIARLE